MTSRVQPGSRAAGPAVQRRHSKRLERKNSAAPYGGDDKGARSSGLTGYMADAKLDFDEDEEIKPKRTMTFFRGKKKDKGETKKSGGGSSKGGDDKEQGFIARTFTFTKKKQGEKKPQAKEAAASSKGGSSGGGETRRASVQKTVFISCSALIREVKLCVGDDLQARARRARLTSRPPSLLIPSSPPPLTCRGREQEGLDELLGKLTSQQIPAEQAVKKLMGLVGSTIVQQARAPSSRGDAH